MPKENERPVTSREKRFCVRLLLIGLVASIFVSAVVFFLSHPGYRGELRNWTAPKTFLRRDADTIVKYHVRDYRVPWSVQLRAAIAFAREHGETLYLEDTPPDGFARNRGNVRPVDISETELIALRKIGDFLATHCKPDARNFDAINTQTENHVFATREIADEVKRLLDETAVAHPRSFYVHYLLGVLALEQNDAEAADHFARALEYADCVVICPIMTLDAATAEIVPVVEKRLPFGVVTQHRSAQWGDFELWYPLVETDRHGLVKLPVFREMAAELSLMAPDQELGPKVVETFGVRDIAEPYRFGLYDPVVLSDEQLSQLTALPGHGENLRYDHRLLFAQFLLDDNSYWNELGIAFEDGRIRAVDGAVVMPTLHYANVFGDLHFRGLTRTELMKRLRDRRAAVESGRTSSHDLADGDNFVVSRNDGRTFLCLYFVGDSGQSRGVLTVWDLGYVPRME